MYKLNIINKDIKVIIDNIDEYIKYIEKITNIIWKIIPNYTNYIISEYGNIINVKSKRILKPFLNKDNYYQIELYKNSITKTFSIHRLIYFIFIDKDIEDFDIHHKDENRINNHYSNLEKINRSKHIKYHRNLGLKENLEKYKMYYDLKYKNNLSTEAIAKKYNIAKGTVNSGIRKYKVHLSLDKDFNKYNNFTYKEKRNLYNKIYKDSKIEARRIYLEKAKEIYNRKNKENLTNKQLAKIYCVSESYIKQNIKDHEAFILILNKDFDKFNNFTYKEKEDLRKEVTTLKRNNNILTYGKQIKDLKLSGSSNEDIVKELNLSISRILYIYKQYKKLIRNEEIKKELKAITNKNNI